MNSSAHRRANRSISSELDESNIPSSPISFQIQTPLGVYQLTVIGFGPLGSHDRGVGKVVKRKAVSEYLSDRFTEVSSAWSSTNRYPEETIFFAPA